MKCNIHAIDILPFYLLYCDFIVKLHTSNNQAVEMLIPGMSTRDWAYVRVNESIQCIMDEKLE